MKHQNIYNRLRRIEGQVRGIEEMLSKERPDQDVLIQLEAVRSSVASTISSLIEAMLKAEENGQVILSSVEIQALLRSIKKS